MHDRTDENPVVHDPVQDHVALVLVASHTGADPLGMTSHARILRQELEAVLQRFAVALRLPSAEALDAEQEDFEQVEFRVGA